MGSIKKIFDTEILFSQKVLFEEFLMMKKQHGKQKNVDKKYKKLMIRKR